MWIADKFVSFFDLPTLQGTDKQVTVAENIRNRIILDLLDEIVRRYPSSSGEDNHEQYMRIMEQIRERSIPESNIFWDLLRQDWAIWWIDNRFSEVADFLLN